MALPEHQPPCRNHRRLALALGLTLNGGQCGEVADPAARHVGPVRRFVVGAPVVTNLAPARTAPQGLDERRLETRCKLGLALTLCGLVEFPLFAVGADFNSRCAASAAHLSTAFGTRLLFHANRTTVPVAAFVAAGMTVQHLGIGQLPFAVKARSHRHTPATMTQ